MNGNRASPKHPCPVCGRTDWPCAGPLDNGLHVCRTAEPVAGWRFVRLDADGHGLFAPEGEPSRNGHHRPMPAPRPTPPPPDLAKLAADCGAALTADRREALAVDLGLPVDALDALAVGWWAERYWRNPDTGQPEGEPGAWTFPECDAEGQLIGLGLRWPTGRKGFATGGRRGLTLPADWRELPDPVLIVEGPSDVLAGRSVGLNVVGRFSNTGGADLLASALQGRAVIVLGENDRKPDGRWPGREGAEAVSRKLADAWSRPVPVAYPPEGFKDLRAWIIADRPTAADVLADLGRAAVQVQDTWPPTIALDAEPEPPPPLDLGACWPDAGTRDFILATAAALQVPPELPALLALASVSLAVSGVAEIEPGPGWRETPPLWTCCLLPPGERKSAAFAAVTRPILDWCSAEAARLSPVIAEQSERRRIAECRRDKLRGKAAQGDAEAAAEAVRLSVDLDAEKIIHPPTLLASDATPEAVAKLLSRNGERLGLFSAEGDGLDVAMGRYSDAPNLGVYLSGHAGDPYNANRIGREPVDLKRPKLAVALAIQPQAVAAMLGDADANGRGLVARFLFCRPESRLGSRDVRPKPCPEYLADLWATRLRALLDLPRRADPLILALTPAADALFLQLQRTIEAALAEGGELRPVAGWGSKLSGAVARIALSLHAAQRPDLSVTEVSDATMRAAIAWTPALIAHYRAVAGPAVTDPRLRPARKLLDWIARERVQTFTFRDHRGLVTADYPDVAAWGPVYDLLRTRGWLRPDPQGVGPKGGRPGDRWLVNPAALSGLSGMSIVQSGGAP